MSAGKIALLTVFVALLGTAYWLFALPATNNTGAISNAVAAIERGRYLVTAGGCISCHKGSDDDNSLSGGLALESDFGTFYAPNITPDRDTGIGTWTSEDFLLALKHGRTPAGSFYYPAFPYRAYAGLSDQDVLDMAAYLMSLPAVSSSTPNHQKPAWLFRWMVAGWNTLSDLNQPEPLGFTNPAAIRGAYLARNLGHCGECHTPRSGLGIPDNRNEFAGAEMGDQTIEAIDAEALAEWQASDFELFLFLGLKPDGEFAGGDMGDVIEHNTSQLTEGDRAALAAFFVR